MAASFLEVSPASHFSLQNLPYGVFSTASGGKPRNGVALGDPVIDLKALSSAGLFSGSHLAGSTCFQEARLQKFVLLSAPSWHHTCRLQLGVLD